MPANYLYIKSENETIWKVGVNNSGSITTEATNLITTEPTVVPTPAINFSLNYTTGSTHDVTTNTIPVTITMLSDYPRLGIYIEYSTKRNSDNTIVSSGYQSSTTGATPIAISGISMVNQTYTTTILVADKGDSQNNLTKTLNFRRI